MEEVAAPAREIDHESESEYDTESHASTASVSNDVVYEVNGKKVVTQVLCFVWCICQSIHDHHHIAWTQTTDGSEVKFLPPSEEQTYDIAMLPFDQQLTHDFVSRVQFEK